MRALFPRERSALFRDFAGERSGYGRTEDPYLAPGEARGVSKCPAKIAPVECFGYHRDEIIFLTVRDELLHAWRTLE